MSADRKSSMKCVHRLKIADHDPCLTLGIVECEADTVQEVIESPKFGLMFKTYHDLFEPAEKVRDCQFTNNVARSFVKDEFCIKNYIAIYY